MTGDGTRRWMRAGARIPLGVAGAMACGLAPAAERVPSAGVQTPVVEGAYSALLAGGPQAAQWIELWRLMLGVTTLVFVAILVACALALLRAPRASRDSPPDLSSLQRPERGARRAVGV